MSPEQTAKLVTCLVVLLGLVAWYCSHAAWQSRKDEHKERCKKSFRYLQQRIHHAKLPDLGFLEDQIDDFYAEYITLVDFRSVSKYSGDLHAQLFNRQMETCPPRMRAAVFTQKNAIAN